MLFWALLLLTQPFPVAAAQESDTTGSDIIWYGGQRVIFFAKRNEVLLLDSAWVRYRDMSVYSDSIRYDIKARTLTCHKDVRFRTSTEDITGSLLMYNVDTRRGMMRTARTGVENGFLAANEAWLVKERVLNARRAEYTTCELAHPHYAFYGPRVKLFMDDIAVAEPVVLRIWRVPVLAAPFWLVPVASKRKSGLMPFKVGNARDQGYFAKGISYYWVINDYSDITFYTDIMTKKGVQFRTEGVYIVKPFAQGSVQGSFIREWDTKRRRYSLNGEHASRFLFGTELRARGEFLSDTSYAPEYAEERLDWLRQDMFSFAEVSRRIRNIGSFSARVEDRRDFIRHTRRLNLPGATLGLGTRTLPGRWTITPNLSFSRVLEFADSAGTDTALSRRPAGGISLSLGSPDYPFGNIDISQSFHYADRQNYRRNRFAGRSRQFSDETRFQTGQRLFGVFNTYEALSFRQSDNLDDTLPLSPEYAADLGTSFSLYRVWGLERLNMHGLLHTVTPNIGLTWEPAVTPKGLFGHIQPLDSARAQLTLLVNNGFQAKVGPEKQKRDIGSATFSTSWNLRTRRLSPILAGVSITPLAPFPARDTGPVRIRADMRIDASGSFLPDSMRLARDIPVATSFSWEMTRHDTLHKTETGIRLNLSHSFGQLHNMLTGSVSIAIPGWRLSLNSLGYNFRDRRLTDYSLTLWKDLHCWEAFVNLNRLGAKWTYDFAVQIKKLPEVKFGKSTFRTFLPGP
ncbi:MAG: putative LPS assembly protein LptD [candidate division WOR-3 bacterium]